VVLHPVLLLRPSGWESDHELGVAPAEADVDGSRRKVRADLTRCGREGLEQDEPRGCLERCRKPRSQGTGLLAARFGRAFQLLLKCVDITLEIHDVKYDVIVTSM
jgi:hypothetical protein